GRARRRPGSRAGGGAPRARDARRLLHAHLPGLRREDGELHQHRGRTQVLGLLQLPALQGKLLQHPQRPGLNSGSEPALTPNYAPMTAATNLITASSTSCRSIRSSSIAPFAPATPPASCDLPELIH